MTTMERRRAVPGDRNEVLLVAALRREGIEATVRVTGTPGSVAGTQSEVAEGGTGDERSDGAAEPSSEEADPTAPVGPQR